MRGQREVRERSEYSMTVLSTGSARVRNVPTEPFERSMWTFMERSGKVLCYGGTIFKFSKTSINDKND